MNLEADKQPRMKEVVELLEDHGQLKTSELEDMLNSRVRGPLKRLREDGLVESRPSLSHPNGKVHTLTEGSE